LSSSLEANVDHWKEWSRLIPRRMKGWSTRNNAVDLGVIDRKTEGKGRKRNGRSRLNRRTPSDVCHQCNGTSTMISCSAPSPTDPTLSNESTTSDVYSMVVNFAPYTSLLKNPLNVRPKVIKQQKIFENSLISKIWAPARSSSFD